MKLRVWKIAELFATINYFGTDRIHDVGYSAKYRMGFSMPYDQHVEFYGEIDPTVKGREEERTGEQIFKRV